MPFFCSYLWGNSNSHYVQQQQQQQQQRLPLQQNQQASSVSNEWRLVGIFDNLGYNNPVTIATWQPVVLPPPGQLHLLQQQQQMLASLSQSRGGPVAGTLATSNNAFFIPCPLIAACSFGTNRYVALFTVPQLFLKVGVGKQCIFLVTQSFCFWFADVQ